MNEYIIIGDTEQYKDCLIYLCGSSLEHAQKILRRILENPTDNDEKVTKNLTNFRIKEVSEEDCWWHYGCD